MLGGVGRMVLLLSMVCVVLVSIFILFIVCDGGVVKILDMLDVVVLISISLLVSVLGGMWLLSMFIVGICWYVLVGFVKFRWICVWCV